MTSYIMIRHGESSGNINRVISNDYDGHPLTPKGRKQATVVGKELEGIKIDNIYTSPVLRARETAEIIAEFIGCTVIIDERLKERNFGDLNNKNVDEIDWKTLLLKGKYRNLESWEDMYHRILNFVKERNEDIVVLVSHYDPIRVFVAKSIGLKDELSSYGLVISNASSSIVIRNQNDRLKVVAIAVPPQKGMLRRYLQGR
ncbi:MAG: histidine phosphatase family protein [Nitrososphaeria archaeon]